MTNIVCVKYGNKYTHEDVNRLYQMVVRNFSLPFTFYCITEDPSNINKNIQIIEIDEGLALTGYWWKFLVFNPELYDEATTTIYFDLDTIIQNNFEYFLDLKVNDKILIPQIEPCPDINVELKYNTEVNSSIMIFNPVEVKIIYDSFIEKSEYYMNEYFGVCRYLWNTKKENLCYLTFGKDFYSFCKIQTSNDYYKKRIRFYTNYTDRSGSGLLYDMTATICMLNGAHDLDIYEECLDFFSNYYK